VALGDRMATTAAIIAGSTLVNAGIGASSGKKEEGDEGSKMLARITNELFSETGPLRTETLRQAFAALTTGTPSDVGTGIAQLEESTIREGGERRKQGLRENLRTRGLSDSAYAVAAEEDIERAIADLITQTRTQDVKALVNFGRSIGFGAIPQQAIGAATGLADIESREGIAAAGRSASTGQSTGALLSLLLNRQFGKDTTTATAGNSGTEFNTIGRQGLVPENIIS
jgi:hypothetical protein